MGEGEKGQRRGLAREFMRWEAFSWALGKCVSSSSRVYSTDTITICPFLHSLPSSSCVRQRSFPRVPFFSSVGSASSDWLAHDNTIYDGVLECTCRWSKSQMCTRCSLTLINMSHGWGARDALPSNNTLRIRRNYKCTTVA